MHIVPTIGQCMHQPHQPRQTRQTHTPHSDAPTTLRHAQSQAIHRKPLTHPRIHHSSAHAHTCANHKKAPRYSPPTHHSHTHSPPTHHQLTHSLTHSPLTHAPTHPPLTHHSHPRTPTTLRCRRRNTQMHKSSSSRYLNSFVQK